MRGDLAPIGGARGSTGVLGFTSARVGIDLAYVQDEDVEVAQEAYLSDPIVSVLKGGLDWRANVADVVGDRVALAFEGWWSEPGVPDRLTLPQHGEPVERITSTVHRAVGRFDLPVNRWTLVEAGGDVAFAIRPTVRDDDGVIPEPPAVGVNAPTTIDGPLVERTIDVRDLRAFHPSRRGRDRILPISNYTQPTPPELFEAAPRWPMDAFVDTIRVFDPILAERDDVVLRLEGGFLDVRAPVAHVEAIERFVEAERRRTIRSFRVRGTVVTLPLASIPEYFAGLDDGATLVADGGASLLARPGARVVDRASVRFTGSHRTASDGGRSRSYVADYDVEIAQGARIGDPIVREALDGLRFDLDAAYAAEPGALYAEFFIDRADVRGIRVVPLRAATSSARRSASPEFAAGPSSARDRLGSWARPSRTASSR